MSEFKFELGSKAKDTITGFEGIIISRSEWLTGCNTYGIRPKAIKNEYKQESYFDEDSIELASKSKRIPRNR